MSLEISDIVRCVMRAIQDYGISLNKEDYMNIKEISFNLILTG